MYFSKNIIAEKPLLVPWLKSQAVYHLTATKPLLFPVLNNVKAQHHQKCGIFSLKGLYFASCRKMNLQNR
jgi:hypothetical protein